MSRLSGVNNMTHLGLENDLTPPEHLVAMASLWHYGWKWKGTEQCRGSVCTYGPCGLVQLIHPRCLEHQDQGLGQAKQLHKASECPSGS